MEKYKYLKRVKQLRAMQEKGTLTWLLNRRKKASNLRTIRPRRPLRPKKGIGIRQRLIPLPKLIKKADTLFSLYIRKRDGKCVLCGATISLTNGHLIKRGKKPVRWDEKNCFCLCSICNYRDKVDTDYHGRYVSWYIGRYGLSSYQALELLAGTPVDTAWIREKTAHIIEVYGKKI